LARGCRAGPAAHRGADDGGLGIGYYPQKPDGTLDVAVKGTWSQITNTEPLQQDVFAGLLAVAANS
jgi:hypothetical protein